MFCFLFLPVLMSISFLFYLLLSLSHTIIVYDFLYFFHHQLLLYFKETCFKFSFERSSYLQSQCIFLSLMVFFFSECFLDFIFPVNYKTTNHLFLSILFQKYAVKWISYSFFFLTKQEYMLARANYVHVFQWISWPVILIVLFF